MILNRMGNKRAIADKIIAEFPQHDVYIEPFFGAGGIFFNKKLAKFNIVNDLDDDIFNFWFVVKHYKNEFIDELAKVPIATKMLEFYKANHKNLSLEGIDKEKQPQIDNIKQERIDKAKQIKIEKQERIDKEKQIKIEKQERIDKEIQIKIEKQERIDKAVRFIFLSNFCILQGKTLRFVVATNYKKIIEQRINKVQEMLKNVLINNDDAIKFLSDIGFREGYDIDRSFVYCDPPYLATANNYNTESWSEQKLKELIEKMMKLRIRFAISEFQNEKILEIAKKYNLNIITIGERKNIKNRRTEILMTNYKKQLTIFNF